MDIQRFQYFCKTHFQVEERAGELSDARSDPHIGVACISLSVFYMGVLGLGSLLGLDRFLRTSKGNTVPDR